MKCIKLLCLIFLLIFSIIPAAADDWDDFASVDRAWDGQKSITNKEFEQVMDALQEKSKKKEEKQKKKKAKKISGGGTSLHDELNPDKTIPELQSLKPAQEELLINLPVHLIVDGKLLDKGFYNVTAQRSEDKKIYLNLYQAHYLQAQIEATETEDDYGEDEVDFIKIKDYNNSFAKIIFGSIDFNAYAFVPFEED